MDQIQTYEWKRSKDVFFELVSSSSAAADRIYWLAYLQQWSDAKLQESAGVLRPVAPRRYRRETELIQGINAQLTQLTTPRDQVAYKIELCAAIATRCQLQWNQLPEPRRMQWQSIWSPFVEPTERTEQIKQRRRSLHTPIPIQTYTPFVFVPSIPANRLDWTMLFVSGKQMNLNRELGFLIHVYVSYYVGGFFCLRDFVEEDIIELRNLKELLRPYQTRLHRLTLLKKYKVPSRRKRLQQSQLPETDNERWMRLFPNYKTLDASIQTTLQKIQEALESCIDHIWMPVHDQIWYHISVSDTDPNIVLAWKQKERTVYRQLQKWRRWWVEHLYQIRPLHRRSTNPIPPQ
jgi:hypothetical protein